MMHTFIQVYGMPFHWFSPTSLSSRNVLYYFPRIYFGYVLQVYLYVFYFLIVCFLCLLSYFDLWHFLNFAC